MVRTQRCVASRPPSPRQASRILASAEETAEITDGAMEASLPNSTAVKRSFSASSLRATILSYSSAAWAMACFSSSALHGLARYRNTFPWLIAAITASMSAKPVKSMRMASGYLPPEMCNKLHPGHEGHALVGHDDVNLVLLHHVKSLGRRGCRVDVVIEEKGDRRCGIPIRRCPARRRRPAESASVSSGLPAFAEAGLLQAFPTAYRDCRSFLRHRAPYRQESLPIRRNTRGSSTADRLQRD